MACTTLLLLALKQALWLVVPFLLAIILYYALFPAVRYVTLKGVDRETGAAIVSGGTAPRVARARADAAMARGAGGERPGSVVPLSRRRTAPGRALAR
mgnify:CR=1 FL=1